MWVSNLIFARLTLYLVHNDFHATRGIFPLFDGLEVKDIEKPLHTASVDMPTSNGHNEENNGTRDTNGTQSETKEAHGEEKQNPGLLATAKAAAVEVTNGIKGLAMSN
jgi:methylenetetrahydrofolate reductase (NADPH)